jgi:hypothetical protein
MIACAKVLMNDFFRSPNQFPQQRADAIETTRVFAVGARR